MTEAKKCAYQSPQVPCHLRILLINCIGSQKMKRFPKFLNDIRSGENLELYIIIFSAFVLLFFDLFGYVDAEWLYSVNIAILALIAISLLGNRRRIESLYESSYDYINKTFMSEFPDDFEDRLLTSNEIYILGLTLGKTSIRYQHSLRRAIRNGCHVKVILLDPHGLAIQLAAKRGYDHESVELQRSIVLRSIALFMDLYDVNPSHIEVRVIDYLPSFGTFGLNIDTPSGELFLEHYGYKSSVGDIPRIHLSPSNAQWYEVFRLQLHAFWKDASPWNPNISINGEFLPGSDKLAGSEG